MQRQQRLELVDNDGQEDANMINTNPADEYLEEAREAVARASQPAALRHARLALVEAQMLHALAESLGTP